MKPSPCFMRAQHELYWTHNVIQRIQRRDDASDTTAKEEPSLDLPKLPELPEAEDGARPSTEEKKE